jgi:hypothetical protein
MRKYHKLATKEWEVCSKNPRHGHKYDHDQQKQHFNEFQCHMPHGERRLVPPNTPYVIELKKYQNKNTKHQANQIQHVRNSVDSGATDSAPRDSGNLLNTTLSRYKDRMELNPKN